MSFYERAFKNKELSKHDIASIKSSLLLSRRLNVFENF